MRQTFDIKGGPQDGRAHLPLLRKELGAMGLDGFYVPHDDEYQNEYLPDANERLAWVSGFTGSFGSAFVFTDKAVIFADGRYTIQAADQTAPELWDREAIPEPGAFGWLAKQKLSGKTVGYDPRLMSPNDVTLLQAAAKKVRRHAGRGGGKPDRQGLDGPSAAAHGGGRTLSCEICRRRA